MNKERNILKNIIKIVFWNICIISIVFVLIFLFFETFPTAIQVNSYYFPYLGTNYDYEPHEQLIFRSRPTKRRFLSFGSYYKKEYEQLGVIAKPTEFDITIGQSGFREDPLINPVRILTIGDSFVQIAESEKDTFSQYLQKNTSVGTLNRGIAWYGPNQYIEIFKKYGESFRGSVVLFCFFEGNDLNDIREYKEWKSGGSYYDHYSLHPNISIFERFNLFLRDFTELYSRLPDSLIKKKPSSKKLVKINMKSKVINGRFHPNKEFRTKDQILEDEDGRELANIIAEIKTFSTQWKIYPLFVFIPTYVHVYGEFTTDDSGDQWKAIKSEKLSHRSNFGSALEFLTLKYDIDFLDLTKTFKKHAQGGEMLYYPFDSHWNSKGRQVAADEVANFLIVREKIK